MRVSITRGSHPIKLKILCFCFNKIKPNGVSAVELKYLSTVKKIVETGSYQKAAAAQNYAQSTITFQVRQLERELGVPLFEKKGGRMTLTQPGKELLPLIDKVLDSVDALSRRGKEKDGLFGALTVALPESLVTYQIQPILKEFKEKAPHVRLALRVMNCFAIYDQLPDSDMDIAVHYDVGVYPKSVSTRKLKTFPLALVCSPNLPDRERDFVTPNQKKALCHIQNDRDALSLKIFQHYLRQRAITLETGIEVWSIEAIKKTVMSNLGVAYLPRFTVEQELAAGTLQEVPTAIAKPEMTALCAYSKNRWKSPAMELFLQLLIKYYHTTLQ
jgi:DNA-binding transcriptional LysR family regulator